MKVTEIDLTDLLPDHENARRHTPENIRVIQAALEDVGPARSILLDDARRVLAGNGVAEAALAAGIRKVLLVETDGKTVVAVRRKGLTAAQKRRLAIADNRANELSQWDPLALRAALDGLDAYALGFADGELEKLLKTPTAPQAFDALPSTLETTRRCTACGYEW